MKRPRRKERTVTGEEFVVVDEFGNVVEVDVMSREEALAITDRIREYIVAEWELRAQAFLGYVWIPLGYKNFEAYLVGEFGPNRLRLPRRERRAAVAYMRSINMSVRAIALAAGCDKNTVLSDLAEMKAKASQAQASEFHTPGSAITDESRDWLPFIRGLDKKIYPPPRPKTAAEKNADKPEPPSWGKSTATRSPCTSPSSLCKRRSRPGRQNAGRTGSDDEWDLVLCTSDQLMYMRDLTKEMRYSLDEIVDASPTLLDQDGDSWAPRQLHRYPVVNLGD